MAEHQSVDLTKMPDAMLMYCSDGRFYQAFEEQAQHQGVTSLTRKTDRILIPGPAFSLVSEDTQPGLLKQLMGLAKHRNWKVLSINDHFPCGWMAENVDGYAAASPQEMINFHAQYLSEAAEIVRQALLDLPVEVHLFDKGREVAIPSLSQRG